MLGYLMYRSALVPQRMAILGMVAGSLIVFNFAMMLIRRLQEWPEGPSGLLHTPGGPCGSCISASTARGRDFGSQSPLARPEMAMAD